MESSDIELWGGVECTVNRVGDVFFDQLERTGHATRLDDLDRLAHLGVRAVRYPILWERTTRSGASGFDFSWTDERLERLRRLGIRVIAGLVHHGSGPLGTSLLDESFISGLADFARAVAARYPWICDFTPVNEPLTTARFSALYGHWYPHASDSSSFLRALMVQTRATVRAMRAIREVTANARLIQTEDFGTIFSTPKLRYQAEFENARRWLSLDLLVGRVTRRHPLYEYLLDHGVTRQELRRLERGPCPPDIIGVNYYVTSDRFLDDRLSRYPTRSVGSNGRHRYVDVEAVRVRRKGIVGHRDVLAMVWSRYHLPLAITEVHLGCTPEEQVRWLSEAWNAARSARQSSVDVRAVTLWSAFGAYDWDSLVTLPRGHYEAGAFDVRGPTPQPTALARVATDLSQFGGSRMPVLETPGWWRSPNRFLQACVPTQRTNVIMPRSRPILVTGDNGPLLEVFRSACEDRGLHVSCLTRDEFPSMNAQSTTAAIRSLDPWLVIRSTSVPWCDAELAAAPNSNGLEEARILAKACKDHGARLVALSSALVFDGKKRSPYVESDPVHPFCELGREHASIELGVREVFEEALVVRSGFFFSALPQADHLRRVLHRRARDGRVLAPDNHCSLTFAPEFAHTCLDLALAQTSGTVHLAHAGTYTILDFMRQSLRAIGIDAETVPVADPMTHEADPTTPSSPALNSERVSPLSNLEECLDRLTEIVRTNPDSIRAGLAA